MARSRYKNHVWVGFIGRALVMLRHAADDPSSFAASGLNTQDQREFGRDSRLGKEELANAEIPESNLR